MSRLNQCLRGVRVLDLSSYLPGPFASLLLADFGAEVLKVEPPQGDGMLQLGPRDADGTPLFHAALNAGKTICRLDLKHAEGKQALLSLAAQADVLIEGFRPGVMQRLGLDHTTLRERNPRLIYCSLSGYGAEGPLSQAAGHDGNYLALAGVLHRNGVPPRCFDPPIADMTSGLFAVIAILGALECRRRDGLGLPYRSRHRRRRDAASTVPDSPALRSDRAAAGDHLPERWRRLLSCLCDARWAAHHAGRGRAEILAAFCDAAEPPDWLARQQEPLPQTALIRDIAAHFATLTTVRVRGTLQCQRLLRQCGARSGRGGGDAAPRSARRDRPCAAGRMAGAVSRPDRRRAAGTAVTSERSRS